MFMMMLARYVQELSKGGYDVVCKEDWMADGVHIIVSKDGSNAETFMPNKYLFDPFSYFILKNTIRKLVQEVDNERSKNGLR